MTEKGIKITVSGKKALDRLYDDTGIKKLVIVGRAIEWVATQDKTLQSVILGQIDPVDSLEILDLIGRRLDAESADEVETMTRYRLLSADEQILLDELREMLGPDELLAKARQALSKVARSRKKATPARSPKAVG